MPLTTDLISYWTLDEASGGRADSTANAYDLGQTGTVGSAVGKVNSAAALDGDPANYLSHADNADLSTGTTSQVTLNCWVWLDPAVMTGGNFFVAGKLDEFIVGFQGTGLGGSAGFLVRADNVGGSSAFKQSSVVPSASAWYMVTAWYDGATDELGVSVNAGARETTTFADGPSDRGNVFAVGGAAFGQSALTGRVDEVGWWKPRVLTAADVTDLYGAGAGYPYPFAPAQLGGGLGGGFPLRRTYRPAPFRPGLPR